MIACGYIYGFWSAAALSLVATVGISQLAFGIARWGGRPVVRHFVPVKSLERWDGFADRYGLIVFTTSFMLPIFPADVMNYVAGLSSMSAARFLVANLLGRLLGVIVLTLMGSHGLALSPRVWVIFVVAGLCLFPVWRYLLKTMESRYSSELPRRTDEAP